MALVITRTALKEWAVAINALTQGETIMLLRKGGIREQGESFQVAEPQFWLYPTYEHQKPHLLKTKYASQVTPVASGWHPETVEIQAWAEVTHSFEVSDTEGVMALLPYHVWNEAFVTERLKWKPRSPLSVLLLRVYRLAQPQMIPYQPAYGGCKSWIELQSISAEAASPALTDADYLQQVQSITTLLAN